MEASAMMGRQDSQPRLFHTFNLEERIGPDHPLRRIQEAVDFGFVRGEVAHCYGANGNVSVDPAVILKMMFLLFYDDVPSERELMRAIPLRLDYLWFLGYGLEDPVPDHSVLSKARRRWGPAVFQELFVRTVRQCVAAGLVDGGKLHMDGSLIDADASLNSVRQGSPELVEALKRKYREQEAKLEDRRGPRLADEAADDDEAAAGDPTAPAPTESAAAEGSEADWATPSETEAPAAPEAFPEVDAPSDQASAAPLKVAPGPTQAAGGQGDQQEASGELQNSRVVSTTDPDAAVVRHGKDKPRPRYKQHRAVDDAHGVVTAVETTPGDVKENGQLLDLAQQHARNTGCDVETIVADSQYGTAENFADCRQRGIRSHMADLALKCQGTGRRKGIFPDTQFVYDAAADSYRCPAGQTLVRRRHKAKRHTFEYTAGAKTCAACPRRPQCTRSKSGRSVKRHERQEAIDAARAQSHSAAAKRDRRRRKHLMEGSFADAANNHGFKRSRWRGLWRQRIQDWLIAAVQNLRILLAHTYRRTAAGMQTAAAAALFWRICALYASVWAAQASQNARAGR
jgi:transposase